MKKKDRKLGYHYSLKSPQYGNCQVLNPEGQLMFRCNQKKAMWYLSRDLGTKVVDDPLTIQLTFIPKGVGHINDPYFLQEMQNRCVVCGIEDDLTRHHIVPYCYRKFFPESLKNHRSYDVMALCIPCHHTYEYCAGEFKKEIAVKYNAPVSGTGTKYDKKLAAARGAANALLSNRDKMPQERQQVLIKKIEDYLCRKPTEDDLNSLVDKNPYDFGNYIHHGKIVISKVQDLEAFVQGWRLHFTESMKPQFLPQYWSIHRTIGNLPKS